MARVVKGLFVYGAGFAPVSVVLRFLQFAVSREPQFPHCGGSPLRLSPGSPPQAAFASFRKSAGCKFASSASVGAVVVLVPKPAGRAPLRTGICKFCEPPQGGASARTAEAGVCDSSFTSLPDNNSYFRLALPPVAYSSLPRSWRTIQNAQFRNSLSF